MTTARVIRGSHTARRDEAEQRLLAAAVRLVAEQGLDGLTLANVGAAAGYSRGLPAHYFGSKDGLIVALADHMVAGFGREVERIEPHPRGLAHLLGTAALYFDSARKDPPATRALMVLLGDALSNPLVRDQIAALNARSAKSFERDLRAAMATGEVRRDIDATAQGFLVLSALRGAVGQWLLAPDAIDLAAIRDEFVASLERSLTP